MEVWEGLGRDVDNDHQKWQHWIKTKTKNTEKINIIWLWENK